MLDLSSNKELFEIQISNLAVHRNNFNIQKEQIQYSGIKYFDFMKH